MAITNAPDTPKILRGHYLVERDRSGHWIVFDSDRKRLFPDQEFSDVDAASIFLFSQAQDDHIKSMRVERRDDSRFDVYIGMGPQDVLLRMSIPPEVNSDLGSMAGELGITKGDVILKAIALLKFARDAKKEGKRVAILDDQENTEQDITGF